MSQFKNIIAIASGKGGVGKSTVSANLAVVLSDLGFKVGLMDADVYGPSIPTILGITEKPSSAGDNKIFPVEKYGLKVISMGFFIAANEAVIWRGPMLHKMVSDFLNVVEWGEIDFLIVDLPPGTGDVQLSLCQSIAITGAVVVSTPQDVAWNVAQKAIMMFDKLNAPVVGVVENMSGEIFGRGGAQRAARVLGIPFLGEIPLAAALRISADEGKPLVQAHPTSPAARALIEIGKNLSAEIKNRSESPNAKIFVKKIGPAGQSEILIEWNDGKLGIYPARDLRLACPCAGCVHELTGERTVKSENIPADIRAVSINAVGRYALQINWSDGHATGLYGFDYLRGISDKKS